MVEFGKRLKTLRKEKNLTQKQLSALIGVQNSIISFYEVGDRMPSPEVIIKLSHVLHVSTDFLLGVEKQEKQDLIDVSGLNENDRKLVQNLIDTLREKNQK